MSSKRDWNDVSDDDSQDSNNISLDDITPDQKQQIKAPELQKITSEAVTQKKSVSNEQQNLRKLQNCPNQKIWLFSPLYYKNNVDDVSKIIKKIQNVIKIDKFIKGWNILIKRQQAKKLIIQGKKQQNIFIKFYFSNKNDDVNQHNYKESNQQYNYKSSQSNPNFNNHYNNDNHDKKVKYVPKSPNKKFQQKKITELKQPNISNFKQSNEIKQSDVENLKLKKFYSHNEQQISSPRNNYKNKNDGKYQSGYNNQYNNNKNSKFSNKYNKKQTQNSKQKQAQRNNKPNYKPKYVSKNSQQQKQKLQTKISNEQQIQSRLNKKDPIKNQQKTENNQQSEENNQSPDKSLDNSPKSPTIKKKKNKPKKKGQMLKDSNNPFSMLGCC